MSPCCRWDGLYPGNPILPYWAAICPSRAAVCFAPVLLMALNFVTVRIYWKNCKQHLRNIDLKATSLYLSPFPCRAGLGISPTTLDDIWNVFPIMPKMISKCRSSIWPFTMRSLYITTTPDRPVLRPWSIQDRKNPSSKNSSGWNSGLPNRRS